MFNFTKGITVCALALAACVITSAQSRITCSSNKGARQYCDADTRNGVILFKQLSQARCVQGRSWGFDRRGIWVDQGCSAVFALGQAGGRPGYDRPGYDRPDRPGSSYPSVQVITCESNNGKKQYCRQDDTSARVRLIKQRSDSKCVEGYSWGSAPGSVWVDHGCRGDFEVRSGR